MDNFHFSALFLPLPPISKYCVAIAVVKVMVSLEASVPAKLRHQGKGSGAEDKILDTGEPTASCGCSTSGGTSLSLAHQASQTIQALMKMKHACHI